MRWIATVALLSLLGAADSVASAPAERVVTPHAEVELRAERTTFAPGDTLWVGLTFDLAPGWHVYWRNPGDSGEAPRIDWRLPAGWAAGDIHWPTPQRIPVQHLVNYGYEDTVTLLVPLVTPATGPADTMLRASATWLVCRETCVPESGEFALRLGPGAASAGAGALAHEPFDAVRARWPVEHTGAATYVADGDRLRLTLAAGGLPGDTVRNAWFAADDWGPVTPAGEQTWTLADGLLRLDIPSGPLPPATGDPLRGIVVVETVDDTAGGRTGILVDAQPGAPAAAAPATDTRIGWWGAMLLAFAGGLLLNLMPCVLPVLSIKALGLMAHGRERAALHGVAFSAGVLASFAALAAILALLRAGGEAIGWGFQLQEPLVITLLLYLMLAIGLNLSGAYGLGGRWMGVGDGMAARGGSAGAVASGVLAVIVASPCTAPFLGAAVGFAATRDALTSLSVFLALGLGFALPMLLLSLWPAGLRRLPRPGPWMERLRNALAFPMYATAAWLLWVLSQQTDAVGLATALAGAVTLAFGLWWLGQPLRNRRLRAILATALVGIAVVLPLTGLAGRAPAADPTALAGTEPWSPARVAELRAAGDPVLVNFTAAWCITCKVNEQVALNRAAVREALATYGVVYLKADWTRRDAAIGDELRRHGRDGVPLYLLYPADGGPPRILPQLLTEGIVLAALQDL